MITANQLTSGQTGGVTSLNTASISPTSGRLILLAIGQDYDSASTPNEPTVTGCGLTWVKVRSALNFSENHQRVSVFRALGQATAGELTISFSGQSQQSVQWGVTEFRGVDRSGTNGSGAIVQSADASLPTSNDNTPLTVSLSSFGSQHNATYYMAMFPENNATPTSGMTQLFLQNQDLGPDNGFSGFWKAEPETAPSSQWSGPGAGVATAIALEIKENMNIGGPVVLL